MDTLKQENYALLHDESDLEEYDKGNVSTAKSNGKSNLRRLTSKMTWMQPQWLCHTTFIVVLVLTQLALCIFVLSEHMGAKKSNMEYTKVENNEKNSHLYPTESRSPNGTHMNDDQKMEQLQPQYHTKDENLLKRVHTLEVNIKSLTKAVSIQGEDIKALMAHQKTDGTKYEKALERQFNNVTTALNSLQNRLEEGLELSFSQISQLRDDVYFMENSLNRTKQERLGESETAMKSTKMRSTVQSVPEPQTHAPLTTFVPNAGVPDSLLTVWTSTYYETRPLLYKTIQSIPTTAHAVSKEKEEPREQYHVPTSFLKTRADFQVFFYGADKDADGYLTYEEIKNVLGDESPSEELLLHFDTDQDTLYSYTELMKTFLLKD